MIVASPPPSAVVFPPSPTADSSTLSASMNSLLSKTPSLFASAASKSRCTTPLCASAVNTRLRSVSSVSNAAAISLALASSDADDEDDDVEEEEHAADDDDALLAKSIVTGTKSTKPIVPLWWFSLSILFNETVRKVAADASRALSTGKTPPNDVSLARANTARVHARRIASNNVVACVT